MWVRTNSIFDCTLKVTDVLPAKFKKLSSNLFTVQKSIVRVLQNFNLDQGNCICFAEDVRVIASEGASDPINGIVSSRRMRSNPVTMYLRGKARSTTATVASILNYFAYSAKLLGSSLSWLALSVRNDSVEKSKCHCPTGWMTRVSCLNNININ